MPTGGEPSPRRRRSPLAVLETVESFVAGALLLAVLGLVVFQVVSRYVFSTPFVWSEELARFALLWLTFVASGMVMARRLHVRVSVGDRLLGRRGRVVVEVFAALVVLVVCVLLVLTSPQFLTTAGRTASPAAGIPMGWVYGSAVVGFVLMGVHGVAVLVAAFRDEPAADSEARLLEGL